MKLVTLDEYLEIAYSPKSRPSRRKIIRLLNEGVIQGRKYGRMYYIDMDVEAKAHRTGNPLVDAVLEDNS